MQAARKTLVMLPPNALLTVFKSVSGIDAKATARSWVSGALNKVCGTGPLMDDAAGVMGSGSLVPRSRLRTARSTPVTASASSQAPVTLFSKSSLTVSVTRSTSEGVPRLRSVGRLLAGSSCGPVVKRHCHMDAGPAPPSHRAGDIFTANAHRPPARPSMLHASHSGRSCGPVVSCAIRSANSRGPPGAVTVA